MGGGWKPKIGYSSGPNLTLLTLTWPSPDLDLDLSLTISKGWPHGQNQSENIHLKQSVFARERQHDYHYTTQCTHYTWEIGANVSSSLTPVNNSPCVASQPLPLGKWLWSPHLISLAPDANAYYFPLITTHTHPVMAELANERTRRERKVNRKNYAYSRKEKCWVALRFLSLAFISYWIHYYYKAVNSAKSWAETENFSKTNLYCV